MIHHCQYLVKKNRFSEYNRKHIIGGGVVVEANIIVIFGRGIGTVASPPTV